MKKTVILSILAACCLTVNGQGTIDDYNRAYSSASRYSGAKVKNARIQPMWVNGTDCFIYVQETDNGNIYTAVNARNKTKRTLFDHRKLAATLTKSLEHEVSPSNLRLDRLSVNSRLDTLRFIADGHHRAYAVKTDRLIDEGAVKPGRKAPHWMVVDDEKGNGPVTSPDGSHTAFIREHNIWIKNNSTSEERQLSNDGTLGNYYSSYIQWSPDSKKLATCKIRPAEKRYVYYVESSPKDGLQPKLHRQEYAKPGDELRFKTPCIFSTEGEPAIIPDTRLFDRQYDLYGPRWNDDSRAVTFEYNQRGHKVYRVLELSAETGNVTTLIEETHDKYVNYTRRFRHDMKDNRHIIWMSERDNWNHLYIIDRTTGKPVRQITRGPWYVREVIRVDEASGKIYFSANGVDPAVDPYFISYYSINLDGTDMRALTPGTGMHKAVFSPDMKYVVDTYSTVDTPPVAILRSADDGSELMTVERADASALYAEKWKAPEVFTAPGRDGKTPMWGVIYRPSNFDPTKKYPVIEYIYQGPGDQYVPKTFAPYNHWMTPIAELGFIVVMVDGLGTSFRSREFENFCYKNLGDAGIPDHIAWIKAAADKYSYMDINRVGIFGCSAGGQESTSALLNHPEFYKAAYSACGCHDNRMDKIWWNELWMGYPVDASYARSSNVVNAHKLSRPLMLVVGEMDDNVDPASTMQVADALIKANKDFELVVIPGAHHTMGEAYGDHKRYDFFVKHLHGVTPPQWTDITYK